MVGRIGSDLADQSCLQIGNVQPSSTPAMKLKLPKANSIPGMKVIALMLIGAIELAEMILITPLPGAPTVGVCYRQYYLYGGSLDLKSDGSTRHSKQGA